MHRREDRNPIHGDKAMLPKEVLSVRARNILPDVYMAEVAQCGPHCATSAMYTSGRILRARTDSTSLGSMALSPWMGFRSSRLCILARRRALIRPRYR